MRITLPFPRLLCSLCADDVQAHYQHIEDLSVCVPSQALRTVCSSSLDPWKTLGVSHDADEKQIKKAYRKLALE